MCEWKGFFRSAACSPLLFAAAVRSTPFYTVLHRVVSGWNILFYPAEGPNKKAQEQHFVLLGKSFRQRPLYRSDMNSE